MCICVLCVCVVSVCIYNTKHVHTLCSVLITGIQAGHYSSATYPSQVTLYLQLARLFQSSSRLFANQTTILGEQEDAY